MRKWFIGVLIVVIAITTCGCWNRREIVELGIVVAIGIDKAPDGKISTTFQLLRPGEVGTPATEGGGGAKAVWTLTSTGYTLFDAIRNGSLQSSRKLFMAQNKIVVIGEELARSGVEPVLDMINRDNEPRLLSWFIIAKGEAREIVEAEHPQEKISANAIETLVRAYKATSKAVAVNTYDFMKMVVSKTTDPIASGIELTPAQEDDKKKKEGSQSKEQSDDQPQKQLKLTGCAVFKEDKLVGWLDQTETRGLNWILGKIISGMIVVKSPTDETKHVNLEIIDSSSKIIPEIRDGKVSITVEIKEDGNLAEQVPSDDLTKPEPFLALEDRKAWAIKNEIDSALSKAQKWGVDIFGFGEAVHRKYPKEWKELEKKWRDEFPQVEVKVEVDCKLRRHGLITKPLTSK